VQIAVETQWVGFEHDDPNREIREASLVNHAWWVEAWQALGESFLVVNAPEETAILLGKGGNALVEQRVAEVMFPERLKPQVYDSPQSPKRTLSARKPERVFDRAETPKVRMKVLERDKYRCRICGRRANEHVDVELNVHHIIPWREGGLSEQKNLITLCRTCHRGLHPHFRPELFTLLPEEEKLSEEELRFDYRVSEKLYKRAWLNLDQ
jgi:5-methylcytosine-specific restriction endonuclease McrA